MLILNREGEYIIVEVQVTGGMNYFRRMLYAVSKTITEHMKLGMEYKEVKKVYSVNVVYFSMELKDDYVYHGTNEFRGMHTHTVLQMSEKERKSFGISEVSDIFPEYYLLCVNNFNTVALTPLDEWISYLKDNKIPATATAPGLAEARELLVYDQMSPDERYRYENYLKQLSADNTSLSDAVRKGKVEERYTIAANMKKLGVAPEMITQFTGLTIEEIQTL